MQQINKMVMQEVDASQLDYEVNKNIEYGHTIVSIIPVKLTAPHGLYNDFGFHTFIVNTYKIIMLDCRYNG